MNEKICPLLRPSLDEHGTCQENKCAWYNPADGMCSIVSISIWLEDIDRGLSHLVKT